MRLRVTALAMSGLQGTAYGRALMGKVVGMGMVAAIGVATAAMASGGL